MNAGYAGSNAAVPQSPREPSLNERLNRVSERLQSSCERIESVLARVNGTPQSAKNMAEKLAQINPTLPMTNIVEQLEAINSRLHDLANGVERIA